MIKRPNGIIDWHLKAKYVLPKKRRRNFVEDIMKVPDRCKNKSMKLD